MKIAEKQLIKLTSWKNRVELGFGIPVVVNTSDLVAKDLVAFSYVC